jgi:histone deacetylase 1/2
MYKKACIILFVLIYVDGIIVTSSLEKEISVLLQQLGKSFALKDLGDLHYFMRIKVTRCLDGLVLTQSKYAVDVLAKFNISTCTTMRRPLGQFLRDEDPSRRFPG